MDNNSLIDMHCHFADPRLSAKVSEVIARAELAGFTTFVQGGVGPEDWEAQRALQARFHGVLPVFGLHPYWVASQSADACEQGLDLLAKAMAVHKVAAVGELGLDFRAQFATSRELQIDVFRSQLELVQTLSKPIVLHIVRAFTEAERVLRLVGVPLHGGWVHAFNGTWAQAKVYLDLNLHLSLGTAILWPRNRSLVEVVKKMPLERLCLESDCPDQPPPNATESHSTDILRAAERIGEIRGVSAREVLDIVTGNCRKLLA